LAKKDYQGICNAIAKISSYIRFVAVINKKGELLSFYRRHSLRPMLNAKDTKYQFSHIAKRTDMEAFFDKSLGPKPVNYQHIGFYFQGFILHVIQGSSSSFSKKEEKIMVKRTSISNLSRGF